MTITSQARASSFAEFLADPDHVGDLTHMFWSLGGSGILFPSDAEELISALHSDESDDELLFAVEELAQGLSDTATTLRRIIADYFEQSGSISQVTTAIEAFVAAPTESNQCALMSAAGVLDGHPIPRVLKGKIAPFVKHPRMRARMHFGSLRYVVERQLKVDRLKQEAA